MRNNLHLNLLYNFVEKKETHANSVSFYKILHFFSEVGPISERTLDKVYENYPTENEFDGISFRSLDELGQFAVDVCIELSAPEIFILSVQDYNIGLDSCNDIRSFKEIFRRYGSCIANPHSSLKKKNLFSKIFD